MDANEKKGRLGEEFVNQLAYNSYLKYWCYPGPKDERGDKKEIADLLILFKDILLIISVKNYEFKGKYDKYFKRTIEKATSQIHGAERKIFESNRDLYIKHPDRQEEKFDKSAYARVYRLIVNLGESVRFYPSNSLTPKLEFVHILDKDAFGKLVNELDTMPDLIEYLDHRERIFTDKNVVIMPGAEEDFDMETISQFFEHTGSFNPMRRQVLLISGTEIDLLAVYLEHNRSFGKDFYSTEFNHGVFDIEGAWNKYLANKSVRVKKEADRASYFVDQLVANEFLPTENEIAVESAKELMSFSRFERRVIGEGFLELAKQYILGGKPTIARKYLKVKDLVVAYVIYSKGLDEASVDFLLSVAVNGYFVFFNYPNEKIMLIAIDSDFEQFKFSLYKDVKPFDKTIEAQVLEDMKGLGLFTNMREFTGTAKEYPTGFRKD